MPATRKPTPRRRRRNADDARAAILDAAERRLVESGPDGIRLQELAADVGVSHPTVLHHFGNREALINAVVERSLRTLQLGLMETVAEAGVQAGVHEILERVYARMKGDGSARSILWIALSGYRGGVDGETTRRLAELVHELRRARTPKGKRVPPFEDTWFSVLFPTLALLSLAILEERMDPRFDSERFRGWIAQLMLRHFAG